MKRILTGLLSFAFILTLAGCNSKGDEIDKEVTQGVIPVPFIKAYASKDINGKTTVVQPFNTEISLSYYYEDEKEKVADYFVNEFVRLHSIFDRHYYYFDENNNLINNLRVINESNGEPVVVSSDLIEIINEGIRFTKLSEGVFNIGVGSLSDLWNGFIDIGGYSQYVDYTSAYRFKYENGSYSRDDDGTYLNYRGVYVDISEITKYELIDGNYVSSENGKYLLTSEFKPSEEQINQAKLCIPSYEDIEKTIVIDNENKTISINKPQGCNGNFSITLGALAKSYAAEKVSENIDIKNGHFLINAGTSTIKVLGENVTRSNGRWGIAISDSYLMYKYQLLRKASLRLEIDKNTSISTSSGDQNHYYYKDEFYHHIINPITGYPNQNRLAVTASGSNAMYVDIATTTLMSMNIDQSKRYLKKLKDLGINIDVVIQDIENDFLKVYVSKNISKDVTKRTSDDIQEHINSIPIEEFNYDS